MVFVCFYLGGKGSYLREGNDCADTEFSFYLDCPFPPLEIKNLQPQSSSAVLRDAVGLICPKADTDSIASAQPESKQHIPKAPTLKSQPLPIIPITCIMLIQVQRHGRGAGGCAELPAVPDTADLLQ